MQDLYSIQLHNPMKILHPPVRIILSLIVLLLYIELLFYMLECDNIGGIENYFSFKNFDDRIKGLQRIGDNLSLSYKKYQF